MVLKIENRKIRQRLAVEKQEELEVLI